MHCMLEGPKANEASAHMQIHPRFSACSLLSIGSLLQIVALWFNRISMQPRDQALEFVSEALQARVPASGYKDLNRQPFLQALRGKHAFALKKIHVLINPPANKQL